MATAKGLVIWRAMKPMAGTLAPAGPVGPGRPAGPVGPSTVLGKILFGQQDIYPALIFADCVSKKKLRERMNRITTTQRMRIEKENPHLQCLAGIRTLGRFGGITAICAERGDNGRLAVVQLDKKFKMYDGVYLPDTQPNLFVRPEERAAYIAGLKMKVNQIIEDNNFALHFSFVHDIHEDGVWLTITRVMVMNSNLDIRNVQTFYHHQILELIHGVVWLPGENEGELVHFNVGEADLRFAQSP